MKHGESIIITVPKDKEIIITEALNGYKMSWKNADNCDIINNVVTVTLEEDMTVEVTNTLNAVAPTGVGRNIVWTIVLLIFGILIATVLKRTKEEKV